MYTGPHLRKHFPCLCTCGILNYITTHHMIWPHPLWDGEWSLYMVTIEMAGSLLNIDLFGWKWSGQCCNILRKWLNDKHKCVQWLGCWTLTNPNESIPSFLECVISTISFGLIDLIIEVIMVCLNLRVPVWSLLLLWARIDLGHLSGMKSEHTTEIWTNKHSNSNLRNFSYLRIYKRR